MDFLISTSNSKSHKFYQNSHCITVSLKSSNGAGVYLAGLEVFRSVDSKMAGGNSGTQSTETADLNRKTEFKILPNPARSNVNISYSVPQSTKVSLKVYDITGKEVAVLQNSCIASGKINITWNCSDKSGRRLPNGTYFLRLASNKVNKVEKVLVLR